MAEKASMLFKTRAGAQLELGPHPGRTGAVGIFMPREGVDAFFPLPKYTEQYAESPDTEGGRRVLSQVQNATGAASVIVSGDDAPSFHSWQQRWQEFVEEMRRDGGTLTYTPGGQRTNLVPQPSPEVANTLWSGVAAFFNNESTVTRDTATAQVDGVACWKVVCSGANAVEGFFATIPVTKGVTYTYSIYVKGSAGGEEARIAIGGSTLGQAISGTVTLPSSEWRRLSVTYTATETGVARVAVTGPATKKAQTFYADCALVEETAETLPFLPTAAQVASKETAWSGVAWESTSSLVGPVSVTYEVESMKITEAKYDGTMLLGFVQEFGFEFTCRPFGLLAAEDQILRDHDPFSRETVLSGEWAAFDVGAGTLSVSGDQLVPSTTGEKRLHRFGLKAADGVGTIAFTTGAAVITNKIMAIAQKRLDTSNVLWGRVVINAGSSHVDVAKFDAGVETALKTGTNFTMTASTKYWLRQTIAGNVVTVELFTADPDTGATPIGSTTATLAGADATKFGEGVWGSCGLRLAVSATDYRWDDWRFDATALRSSSPVGVFELPDVEGHVDALADVKVLETSTQPRDHVEVGLEKGSTYSPAVAPPNLIDSDQLVTAGYSGTASTRTGAFDPLAAGNSIIRSSLTQTPTAVCATAPLQHVGPLRPKTRVYASGTGPVYVRASARYGFGQAQHGEWQIVPTMGEFCEVDLGLVNPPLAVLGEQGWECAVEAITETPGDTIDVDFVLVLGAGKYAKSKVTVLYETPSSIIAEDSFSSEGSPLSGKALSFSRYPLTSVPGTTIDDASLGSQPWSGPESVKVSDNNYAMAFVSNGESTHRLKSTALGFAVPVGATISGIVVEVEKHGFGNVSDNLVSLVKAGVVTGANRASAGVMWPTADGVSKYGSETDLWGTTWTVAQINSAEFGVSLSAMSSAGFSNIAYVDAVTVIVYYVPSGGSVWTEAGHEPVYKVVTSGATSFARREGSGDVANTGRFAFAGSIEPSTLTVQCDVSTTSNVGKTGIVTRYLGAGNWLAVTVTGDPYVVQVTKYVGASASLLNRPEKGLPTGVSAGNWITLRLQIDVFGYWVVWANGAIVGQGQDPTLANLPKEGGLGKGKVGLYDEHNAVSISKWDNFMMWVPEANPVLSPGRSVRFRWADALRESPDGRFWSRMPGFEGARMRVPPAGAGGLTSRLSVKARRLNVDEAIDPAISDEVQVSMKVTPRVVLLG
jgi:hypothetical protein